MQSMIQKILRYALSSNNYVPIDYIGKNCVIAFRRGTLYEYAFFVEPNGISVFEVDYNSDMERSFRITEDSVKIENEIADRIDVT